MKKDECERAVRYYCGVWSKEVDIPQAHDSDPYFSDFWSWMQTNHPQFLDFRCRGGAMFMVERWFDREFKQTWKN